MKAEVTTPTTKRTRRQRKLAAEDLRQLEDYFALLRAYYGIPADQPVFPPVIKSKNKHDKASVTAVNPDSHPWRGR